MLLRKQGEADALRYVARSLHLNPMAAPVWKAYGHAHAQDANLEAARSAFQAALACMEDDDPAARTGLAAVLAQLGLVGAAADELLCVKRLNPGSFAASLMAEPLERLCRKLMPGSHFASLQAEKRAHAWREVLTVTCAHARILDLSSSPLPAMICALEGNSVRPILRAEPLPRAVVSEALAANSCLPPNRASKRPTFAGGEVTSRLPDFRDQHLPDTY